MKEEIVCSVCGTTKKSARNMCRLDNDECVCSTKCFIEYATSYFCRMEVLKGKKVYYFD